MQVKRIFLSELDSTNLEATRLVNDGLPTPFSVVAAVQTKGKGQRGNVWQSSHIGNLYMTVSLTPRRDISDLQILPILVSNKIVEWVLIEYNAQLRVKAPNDIYFNNKKVGGILLETKLIRGQLKEILFGIGVNVKSAPVLVDNDYQATCLCDICNNPVNLETVEKKITEIILKEYDTLCLQAKQNNTSNNNV